MRIIIDARAAQLYAGTGLGTYVGGLTRQLGAIAAPDSVETVQAPGGSRRLSHLQFWSKVAAPPGGPRGDLYHCPHNGLGLPPEAHRCIVTIHDLIPLTHPEATSSYYRRLFSAQVPAAVARADFIIAVSHQTRQDIFKLFGKTRGPVAVIHEAADRTFRPLTPATIRRQLRALGLAPGYVLYLGGFSPRKNVGTLIHAYAGLPASLRVRHPLLIAGAPERGWTDLYALARRLAPGTLFPGAIPTPLLSALYGGAAVFAYPSLYEGFGLPPLEAMACGTPVLCSDAAALTEVTGDGALRFPPLEVDTLRHQLRRVLEDPVLQRELSSRGTARAAGFSWRRAAQETLGAYRHCVYGPEYTAGKGSEAGAGGGVPQPTGGVHDPGAGAGPLGACAGQRRLDQVRLRDRGALR